MSSIQSSTPSPVSSTSSTSTSTPRTTSSTPFQGGGIWNNPNFLQLLRLIIQILQQIQSGRPTPGPTPPTPAPGPTPPTPAPGPTPPTPAPGPTPPTPAPGPTPPTPAPGPTPPTPAPGPTPPTPAPGPTPPTPAPGPTPPTPAPGPTPPTPAPGPTPPTPAPGPTPPTPAPTPTTASERSILTSLFATNESGNVISGATVTVFEGGTPNNKLSVGDTVIVRNAAGAQVRSKTLTSQDMYEIRFRESMAANTNSIGSGWGFTNDIVKIAGGTLSRPETRSYTDINGTRGTEQVLERNNYWEVVQRGGNRYMVMRANTSGGAAVKPSDAINDLFNNRDAYRFDCATPMTVLNLKATLDTIGADAFNRNTQGKLIVASWYDPFDNSNFDGGYISQVRTARAGEIVVNGHANLAGETARFDPSKGDRLTVGNTYYFDKPGDNTTATQGWNAVYLGQAADGNHRFWSASIGEVSVQFKSDGSWVPTGGTFGNYYLGAAVANPNLPRLQTWDNTGSVAR